ncbi:LOW QUALITY PROTEIN: uncharacterized protein ACR2FA_010380 [Aphomia sociella]
MSLFPAYANKDVSPIPEDFDFEGQVDWQQDATNSREAFLLASDDDDTGAPRVQTEQSPPHPLQQEDFYLDTKLDRGNLRVSTLYYPGRPQYNARSREERRPRKQRARRYFDAAPAAAAAAATDVGDDAEIAARVASFRRMLADTPQDVDLWLRFIDFQERWRGGGAALAAAAEAAARRPRARLLRRRRGALRRRHLAPPERAAALRDDIAAEKSPQIKLELWLQLLEALACSSTTTGPPAIYAAARAALADTRACPRAYPHVLYAYGETLRFAGLWEQLVLLLELVLAMSFPPSDAFPTRPQPARDADVERRLLAAEDEAIASGLPLSAVWVRVESARAAAHWRPARGDAAAAAAAAADPQRAPLPADVAELLQPAGGERARFLLLAQALRLAQVPALPAAGCTRRALCAGGAGGAEALLALVRAARRLPAHPARAARPAAAAAALAACVDPPHYFVDDAGYLSWVGALWEAACGWAAGARRTALLCWRLRWLHALMLLVDPEEESGRAELRRMRGEARAALRRHAAGAALPFAQFARLELVAGAPQHARRAARLALRAALRDAAAPPPHRLYAARVAAELSEPGCGAWATACAALGRAAPSDDELQRAPPADLLAAAYGECERRCEELERSFAVREPETEGDDDDDVEEDEDDDEAAAFLPGDGEWAAARVALAGAARRRELEARLLTMAPSEYATASAERYYEQSACALALAAAAEHRAAAAARALAPRFPHNGLLALMSEGAPLWACGGGAAARRGPAAWLAALLPPLLRAPPARWTPAEARRVARLSRDAAASGACGALPLALRLDAEARVERPAPARALYAALDAAPLHKWLYVRGAQWCGGEAAALADVLLDRQLRLHALRDELEPPAPAPAPALAPASPAQRDRSPLRCTTEHE